MTPPPDIPAGGARGPSEFEGRKPEIQDAVARHKAGDHKVPAGQILLKEGETWTAIVYLAEGWLMFQRATETGARRILQFGLPGTLVGGVAGTAAYNVQTLSDAVISVIPRTHVETLVRENPQIGVRVESLASRPPSFGFQNMPSFTKHSPRERIAQLLLELFIRQRAQWTNHVTAKMVLPLAREHITEATGLGYAETGDALRRLGSDGIVELRDRGIAILNPDDLVDASGIDLGMMRSFFLD